ncbi:hypothetical protein [Nitrobacter hamburgensis]|uniref:hypothetical protein n=1 Tax=Nitrobacter hamburgensis TaxID=912 RepID=UPI0012EDDBF1|nr:hypothetical protein [Nitrobacter hamburgensis]
MSDYNEAQIAEYEARVYPDGGMPAVNKALLRKQLEAEDAFWQKQEVRIDNSNSHDDY